VPRHKHLDATSLTRVPPDIMLAEVAAGFAGEGEELVTGAERISLALLEALRFEMATVGQARQDLLHVSWATPLTRH